MVLDIPVHPYLVTLCKHFVNFLTNISVTIVTFKRLQCI